MFAKRRYVRAIACIVFLFSFVPPALPCPSRCDCSPSGEVSCEGKELQSFPKDLEDNVEILSVAENEITTIPNLSYCRMLTTLNASGNRISVLNEDIFLDLRALKIVDLSNNKISSLPDISADTLFKTNLNLRTLILSSNQISIFDDNRNFIASDSLKELDLSSNQINTLDNKVLEKLPSLTDLHMADNPLMWVRNLQSNSLIYLDVSSGKIDLMYTNQLQYLPRLETLKVSRNLKFHLYNGLLDSSSLQTFEARSCQLAKPGLKELKNLKTANLKGNKIETLRKDDFIDNGKLEHLDLSLNVITQIDQDTFWGLKNIRHLSLAENQISEITWDMFQKNDGLDILNLSKNPINSLPRNLTLSKLTQLDLSQCSIHLLESISFSTVPTLQVLDLSHNSIEQIPNNIESNSLQDLNLAYNRLSSITNETFSKLPNIESLNIIGNRLTLPKQYMFSSNKNLQSILLSDNPWICDCKDPEFKELWEYLTGASYPPVKLTLIERSELKCTSPKNLEGKRWEDACSEEFRLLVNKSTFFDRYGVYILITVMTISFTLVVIVSIRERMKKREKVLRGRLEARRRTVAENHERVVRLYRESVERINEEHRRQEEASLHERVERHPPTYEEAVLMPRREDSSSRDELRSARQSLHEAASTGIRGVGVNASGSENSPLQRARGSLVASDDISIYSEVAEDEDEDEDDGEDLPRTPITISVRPASEGGSVSDGLDEAKLMHQLRIEVWSREDIRNDTNSNND